MMTMKKWLMGITIVLFQASISLSFRSIARGDRPPPRSTEQSRGVAIGHSQRHASRQHRTPLSMCQLLGMNCAALTDFTFSFRGFARRGGDTDVHRHGWGLCFYDGRGLRAFHDPLPAAESLLAVFLQSHPIKTFNMVSHIRYATRGAVLLENVHPFQRCVLLEPRSSLTCCNFHVCA